MSTLAPELAETDTARGDLTHVICCNEDIAVCGTDVSDEPFVGDDVPVDCIVCLDADTCPLCGDPIIYPSVGH